MATSNQHESSVEVVRDELRPAKLIASAVMFSAALNSFGFALALWAREDIRVGFFVLLLATTFPLVKHWTGEWPLTYLRNGVKRWWYDSRTGAVRESERTTSTEASPGFENSERA